MHSSVFKVAQEGWTTHSKKVQICNRRSPLFLPNPTHAHIVWENKTIPFLKMWNVPCLIAGGKFHQPVFVFLQLLLMKHTNKFSVTSVWTFIIFLKFLFSFINSVQSVVSDFLQPQALQYSRLLCPSLSPGVCSTCPLSQWCHPTISSSVAPFSFCLQSFPASGSFLFFYKLLLVARI